MRATSVPLPVSSDPEDVAIALETAQALWKKLDYAEAVRWLRRAALAAVPSSSLVRAGPILGPLRRGGRRRRNHERRCQSTAHPAATPQRDTCLSGDAAEHHTGFLVDAGAAGPASGVEPRVLVLSVE